MRLNIFIAFIMLSALSIGQNVPTKLKLPSLIGDNMLLQQKTNAKIWGKATPGQSIRVSASWKANGQATADKNGKWQIVLPTPEAGGPYTLIITGGDTAITIKNVLIGEVWFCSGQSNMEMPLTGWPPDTIEHSKTEIASANNPNIRLFHVQRALSFEPKDNCIGKWEVCSPSTVQSFSATAYFFGKKLYEKLRVPIGLIESAWGGTPVESWISAGSLAGTGEFTKELSAVKESAPKLQEFMTWLESHKQVEVKEEAGNNKWANLSFDDESCSLFDYNDSMWPIMKLPQRWDIPGVGEFDGAVWYRKKIEMPQQMLGQDIILSLGPIDKMDRVYFNGKFVGAIEVPSMWQVNRIYAVPAKLVKTGINVISVRVLNTESGGGFWGKDDQMKLTVKNDSITKPLQLAGDWKYLPVAEFINNKFYIYNSNNEEFFSRSRPWSLNPNTPTVLFNAMVNPVLSYKIKGAIWYQGETNVGRAGQYAKIFPLMIQDWRKLWNIEGFPFYYVQIAPYEYSNKDSSESAALREAQAKAMNLANTGMVVTLDIGKVKTIHPPYKMEVGERLAHWALAKNYAIKVPYSGPIYKSMSLEGNTIRLQFSNIEGGLVTKNAELNEFEIAGKDGRYVPAKARIVNNEVVVSSPAISAPVSVRYCWRNGAEASLFNGAGLPASVFRIK